MTAERPEAASHAGRELRIQPRPDPARKSGLLPTNGENPSYQMDSSLPPVPYALVAPAPRRTLSAPGGNRRGSRRRPECIVLWESGRRRMDLSKLPRIAAALQLDVKELCAKALAEFYPLFYASLFGESRHRPDQDPVRRPFHAFCHSAVPPPRGTFEIIAGGLGQLVEFAQQVLGAGKRDVQMAGFQSHPGESSAIFRLNPLGGTGIFTRAAV